MENRRNEQPMGNAETLRMLAILESATGEFDLALYESLKRGFHLDNAPAFEEFVGAFARPASPESFDVISDGKTSILYRLSGKLPPEVQKLHPREEAEVLKLFCLHVQDECRLLAKTKAPAWIGLYSERLLRIRGYFVQIERMMTAPELRKHIETTDEKKPILRGLSKMKAGLLAKEMEWRIDKLGAMLSASRNTEQEALPFLDEQQRVANPLRRNGLEERVQRYSGFIERSLAALEKTLSNEQMARCQRKIAELGVTRPAKARGSSLEDHSPEMAL